MEVLFKDLRYALRSMRKSPGFTATVLITLTLGIGINTSIFSFVNRLLFVPMPVERPAELVSLYTTGEDTLIAETPMSYPDYKDFRDRNSVLSDLTLYALEPLLLSTDQTGIFLLGETVTGNYFSTLGVGTVLGRPLIPEDDRPGAEPVVVLNHSVWQSRFGADPQILGRRIQLNGFSFTVVGVARPEFKGGVRLISSQMWIPLVQHDRRAERKADGTAAVSELSDDRTGRDNSTFFSIGRLKPGVTLEQARSNFAAIADQLKQEYPVTNKSQGVAVFRTNDVLFLPSVDGAVAAASTALMLVVSLVLLIACANIANLLIARAGGRRKEIAVRLSIGATRMQVIRQLLTENILLAAIAGILAIGATAVTNRVVNSVTSNLDLPLPIPIEFGLGLDYRILGFTFGVALLTGLVFGLTPAFQLTKSETIGALKDEAASSTSTRRHTRIRSGLVVAQVSLSLILIIGAGLFVRSLSNANSIDPGFRPDGLLTVDFDLGMSGYSDVQAPRFRQQIIERVQGLPTVESAAFTSHLPLQFSINTTGVLPEGHTSDRPDLIQVDTARAGPGYFQTAGVSLIAGRPFLQSDTLQSPRVVIINQAFVNRFWPGETGLGKRVRFRRGGEEYEVVGVAATGRYRTLGEDPRPFIYECTLQSSVSDDLLLVRSSGNLATLMESVRGVVRELDPKLPLLDFGPARDRIAVSLWVPRVAAALFGLFGGLGLVIAAVGVLGVISYGVSLRTREIGIRVALGATRWNILGLVLGQGVFLTLAGLIVGLTVAAGLTRFARTLLYGIQPVDPVAFLGGALVIAAVALLASYIPARRALRINPVTALRSD